MRIYLAARYSRRIPELQECREDLEARGHSVTSRWVWIDHELPIGAPREAGVRFAGEDMADLNAANCLIAFTEEPGKASGRNRGGRHVEFGIALAKGMRVMVVGHRENVFHYLPEVAFYSTWAELLASGRV